MGIPLSLAEFLFNRILAGVYFAAFSSFLVQVTPLFSCAGLAEPVPLLAGLASLHHDAVAIALLVIAALGAVVAWLTALNIAIPESPRTLLFFMWALYFFLSKSTGGWFDEAPDGLLIEVGFLAFVLASQRSKAGSILIRSCLLWCLLRFTFLNTSSRFLFECANWLKLEAWRTEAQSAFLPVFPAWHFYLLPPIVHRITTIWAVMTDTVGLLFCLAPIRSVKIGGLLILCLTWIPRLALWNSSWVSLLVLALAVLSAGDALNHAVWHNYALRVLGAPAFAKLADASINPFPTLGLFLCIFAASMVALPVIVTQRAVMLVCMFGLFVLLAGLWCAGVVRLVRAGGFERRDYLFLIFALVYFACSFVSSPGFFSQNLSLTYPYGHESCLVSDLEYEHSEAGRKQFVLMGRGSQSQVLVNQFSPSVETMRPEIVMPHLPRIELALSRLSNTDTAVPKWLITLAHRLTQNTDPFVTLFQQGITKHSEIRVGYFQYRLNDDVRSHEWWKRTDSAIWPLSNKIMPAVRKLKRVKCPVLMPPNIPVGDILKGFFALGLLVKLIMNSGQKKSSKKDEKSKKKRA